MPVADRGITIEGNLQASGTDPIAGGPEPLGRFGEPDGQVWGRGTQVGVAHGAQV